MPGLGLVERESAVGRPSELELGLAVAEAPRRALDEGEPLVRFGAIARRHEADRERFAEETVGGFVLGVVIGLESGQQGSLGRPGADVEEADRRRRLHAARQQHGGQCYREPQSRPHEPNLWRTEIVCPAVTSIDTVWGA